MNRSKTTSEGSVDGQMARNKHNVVEYRIYDLPLDFPVLCLTGESWRISDVPSNRLHFHNCLEIGFCHTDSGTLTFEDGAIPFTAGDVFIIPRHVPHTTCSARGCRSMWSYLFVDFDALAADVLPSGDAYENKSLSRLGKYLKITAKSDPRLHFLCNTLLEEAKKNDAEAQQMIRLYSLTMVAELQRRKLEEGKPTAKNSKVFPLKPALEYIHDHYTEPCDAETLANLCYLSQTHFRRLFLSCMGSTPLQFVISTRIYQACIMLVNTDEPVLSIAQAVGISSVSSFNRNFQQVMGMSPRQYRETAHRPSPRKGSILTYRGWMVPDK